MSMCIWVPDSEKCTINLLPHGPVEFKHPNTSEQTSPKLSQEEGLGVTSTPFLIQLQLQQPLIMGFSIPRLCHIIFTQPTPIFLWLTSHCKIEKKYSNDCSPPFLVCSTLHQGFFFICTCVNPFRVHKYHSL